jgi:hypothetical protein
MRSVRVCALALTLFPLLAHAQATKPGYQDTSLSPEARARDLVSRMTLEEKAAQSMNTAKGCTVLRVRDTLRCFRRRSAWRPRGMRRC